MLLPSDFYKMIPGTSSWLYAQNYDEERYPSIREWYSANLDVVYERLHSYGIEEGDEVKLILHRKKMITRKGIVTRIYDKGLWLQQNKQKIQILALHINDIEIINKGSLTNIKLTER